MSRRAGGGPDLEALPVMIDGVSRPPLPADAGPVGDAPSFPDFGAWAGGGTAIAPPPPVSPRSFRHMFQFGPGQLDQLSAWWSQRANCGRVDACGLTLHEPQGRAGEWIVQAELRRPLRRLRMELSVWRCIGDWARVTLEPKRRVVSTGAYFRAGHRVLDALCRQLERELRPSTGERLR
ncbi:MAG TPA: hypothetical protein VFR41_05950 [Acidimicrobiia bacterium]|nr:hypothetical protein [Acidimicrobiia bacterium]